jgi:hypothetical protein
MSTFRRFSRTAIAVALLVASTPLVVYGYTWSGVTPANGAKNVSSNPLNCGATVSWDGAQSLTSGSISASATNFVGATTYSYTYAVGETSGVFRGNQQGQDATINFNPPLVPGSSVTLTFTASQSSSGGTTTSSTTTTFSND